jgi:hypothetical protein
MVSALGVGHLETGVAPHFHHPVKTHFNNFIFKEKHAAAATIETLT